MKSFYFCCIFLFSSVHVTATDTSRTLSLPLFLQLVKEYHPVAMQAGLITAKAQTQLTMAKSGFDPVLQNDIAEKTFGGINYYRNAATQLKIPTWLGIEFSAGAESVNGNKINPQETLGQSSFAGITVPLLKNLVMDKRRAALQQAQWLQKAAEQEKKSALNDLYKDAADAYWQWVYAYSVYELNTKMIAINQERFRMIKKAFAIGEMAAVDTTEALAQLLQMEYRQNEARLEWSNASAMLTTFLWKPGMQYVTLPDDVVPAEKLATLHDEVVIADIEGLLQQAQLHHPDLAVYTFKIKQLQVDKKLKFQELLPKLDLKYNYLSKGYTLSAPKELFNNNFRWGISFAVPLRFSQGRAEYKLAKLKLMETEWQQKLKQVTINSKIVAYHQQMINLKQQLQLLQKNYNVNATLFKNEEIKFYNGESSLFLVNSRENKVQETQIKLAETTVKFNKAWWSLQWAAGMLSNL